MWGFVDCNGCEVIFCCFKVVKDFSEGKVVVWIGNCWGFVNDDGDIVIFFNYEEVGNF